MKNVSNISDAVCTLAKELPFCEVVTKRNNSFDVRYFITFKDAEQLEILHIKGIPTVEFKLGTNVNQDFYLNAAINKTKAFCSTANEALENQIKFNKQYRSEIVGMDKDSADYHFTKNAISNAVKSIELLTYVIEEFKKIQSTMNIMATYRRIDSVWCLVYDQVSNDTIEIKQISRKVPEAYNNEKELNTYKAHESDHTARIVEAITITDRHSGKESTFKVINPKHVFSYNSNND